MKKAVTTICLLAALGCTAPKKESNPLQFWETRHLRNDPVKEQVVPPTYAGWMGEYAVFFSPRTSDNPHSGWELDGKQIYLHGSPHEYTLLMSPKDHVFPLAVMGVRTHDEYMFISMTKQYAIVERKGGATTVDQKGRKCVWGTWTPDMPGENPDPGYMDISECTESEIQYARALLDDVRPHALKFHEQRTAEIAEEKAKIRRTIE